MADTGFLYYYDLLGFSPESYQVHYDFNVNSGTFIPNSAPLYPENSGILSSVGNFYQVAGSGFFSGQNIAIQAASGLNDPSWSHIFIYDRSINRGGVLFDSFSSSNNLYSGYIIGINDNNRLYFESFDDSGPLNFTSDIIFGRKNFVAIVKTESLLSFYCYDFNNKETLSSSYPINGQFIFPSNKAILGMSSGSPVGSRFKAFSGYIDEYVYLKEALNPSSFEVLASGFLSHAQTISGTVSTVSGTGITGYSSIFTGVTGILSYTNTITGSGLDPFGEVFYLFDSVAVTGYLSSGILQLPLTGISVQSITGDATSILVINTGFINSFGLDEVSFIRKIDQNDFSLLNLYTGYDLSINNNGEFDAIEGEFQLNNIYNDNNLGIYLNGVAQIQQGYSVTGNLYNNGLVLSGNYLLSGYQVVSTGSYQESDSLIYDVFSGIKTGVVVTNLTSGTTVAQPLSGIDLFFLNGLLLASGIDYRSNGGSFQWITNKFSGITGLLSRFSIFDPKILYTGIKLSTGILFPRRNSQLFLNGQRQLLGKDYLENSSIDLLGQSGIFAENLELVYNNESF